MSRTDMGGIHEPLVRALLKERGLNSEEEIENFLHPSYDTGLHDPFLLRDMEKAVERILKAIEREERIAVYSDFDCDGIPGASVLMQFFQRIEYDNVESYIPHRHHEGYGLHKKALDKLKENRVSLVITVDLGITAVESVAHANTLGLDVIVTDHHEPPEELPAGFALINPKFAPYPDPNLCGAAVAWKLVCALVSSGQKKKIPVFSRIQEGWEKWLLDLVGIATIADMVPLVGENRVLARYGLLVLKKTPRPGIVALMRELRANQATLTEDDVGFLIGPRINAASRMDEPELALRLLTTRSQAEAASVAKQLEALNKKRKGVVSAMTREINKKLKERKSEPKVTVLGDPDWKPALLGLAANGALSSVGGVVCVWGRDGEGNIKGSCRSDGALSVVELFKASQDTLEEFGGHHAAGGFSVSHDDVHKLQDIFRERAEKIDSTTLSDDTSVYATGVSRINKSLHEAIALLAPFGVGNAKPTLALESVIVKSVRQFGKTKEHLEIILEEEGVSIKAIQFFSKPEQFSFTPEENRRATILGQLEISTFMGASELRMRLVDIFSPEDYSHARIIRI